METPSKLIKYHQLARPEYWTSLTRIAGRFPVRVTPETAIGQTQHVRPEARQQWFKNSPFGTAIRANIRAQNGVGRTFHLHGTLRLWVGGATGTAAGASKRNDIGGLIWNLEVTAVNSN